MALYQCSYRWPGLAASADRRQQFARTFLEADRNLPELAGMVRGWYAYPGEWAGFLVLEAAGPEQLSRVLQAFTHLMEWQVKPLVAHDYGTIRAQLAGSV
jgi:muconolactone delta-isomerase